MEQISPFKPEFHLGQTVTRLEPSESGRFLLETSAGTRFDAAAVILAAGLGAFQPRRLRKPGAEDFEDRNIHYKITRAEDFAGQDVIVLGGGDSALDWALERDPACGLRIGGAVWRFWQQRAHMAEAERRLLPLAAERGIAVIVNRPFQRGNLIEHLEEYPLPGWAGEIGCTNWPQFLLKFIISHPAVTCAIPATSQVEHVKENMGACYGALPDAAMRARMIAYVENL